VNPGSPPRQDVVFTTSNLLWVASDSQKEPTP
jgi:hypothetical protein